MFVRLTNNVDGRKDDPLHINVNHIIAVYEDHLEGGSLVTKVYGGTNPIIWTVQESLGEVMSKIEEAQK
jgi:hypothetical protein